jgi:hypothetical protein
MTLRRRTPDGNLPEGHEKENRPITTDERSPLLTQRAALILIAALAIGIASGVLSHLALIIHAG